MRIAIITGSRADRGPLDEVFRALMNIGNLTGVPRWIDVAPAAYKPNFGSEAVQMAAAAATQVSGELAAISTDLVVMHGDRYEILGAAMGANMMGVPIAHLAGGDITEGSADDCYRHAITKLAHLHFPNCQESADRIIQMGEDPSLVHMVGDPAVDRVLRTPLFGRDETFRAVGLPLPIGRSLVVLLHPALGDQGEALGALLGALRAIGDHVAVVLIGPCADPGCKPIEQAWRALATSRTNTVYHDNLPGDVFLSLLKHCDCLVGNSSAAFYEAPILGCKSVNIGMRQWGRKQPVDCVTWAGNFSAGIIAGSIKHMMDEPRYPINMGDGHAAERIADVIGKIGDPKSLLRKRFQSVDVGRGASAEAMGNVPERARGEVRQAPTS